MRNLGHYVLQGYKQAAWVALLCTLLPLFSNLGLLVGWLGVAILGLVTLRKGALEGFIVLCWVALPAMVLFVLKQPQLLINEILCGSLLTWIFAWVLREKVSWLAVLSFATAMGLIGVGVAHGWIAGITERWQLGLVNYLQQVNVQIGAGWTVQKVQSLAKLLARFATGLQASGILLSNLINLMFARWWQALLFNPGGLKAELLTIRLGYGALGLLVVTLLAMLMRNSLAFDSLPVVLLPFIIAGLSLVHKLLLQHRYRWAGLFVFYGLLLFFLPYGLLLLIGLACIDIKWDLRQRWQRIQ